MGMYNEVFKDCPKCETKCETQIPLIELGFRGYDLDDKSTTKHLTLQEKIDLSHCIEQTDFYCEECDDYFKISITINNNKTEVTI